MVALTELPDDVFSCVFDHLTVTQLVVASHVCKRLRLCALDHETFWSVATLVKNLQPAWLEVFMTRLQQSQIGLRPVSVTVWPQKGWSSYPDQLPFMRTTIIPAIGASLSHTVALHIEVPSTLSEPMVNVLRQPAPLLRSFTITNWHHSTDYDTTAIPSDIFAMSAPQLAVLNIGDGVTFPDDPLPAFQAVQLVKFQIGCNLPNKIGLPRLLEWFPNLLHLDLRAMEVTVKTWRHFPPQLFGRLSALDSIGLHASSLVNLQRIGLSGEFLVPIRHVRLRIQSLKSSPNSSTHVDSALTQCLIPSLSTEMSCWLKYAGGFPGSSGAFIDTDTAMAFVSDDIRPIVREMDTPPDYPEHAGVRIWQAFTTTIKLAALSMDVELWQSFRQYTGALPSLEVLLIQLKSQLPRQLDTVAQGNIVSCPRLNTIIFQSRYAGPERSIVTCRGVDAFLTASLTLDDWTSVEVLLLDVRLYGDATHGGTRITRVSESSRHECANRSPRVGTLLRFAQTP